MPWKTPGVSTPSKPEPSLHCFSGSELCTGPVPVSGCIAQGCADGLRTEGSNPAARFVSKVRAFLGFAGNVRAAGEGQGGSTSDTTLARPSLPPDHLPPLSKVEHVQPKQERTAAVPQEPEPAPRTARQHIAFNMDASPVASGPRPTRLHEWWLHRSHRGLPQQHLRLQ